MQTPLAKDTLLQPLADFESVYSTPDHKAQIEILQKAGVGDKLFVIADFDRTISGFKGPNGEPCDECHDIIFRHCSPSETWAEAVDTLWNRTRSEFGVLRDKPVEERERLARWWWTYANNLMIEHKINQNMIHSAIKKANTAPRAGALDFLQRCVDCNIPVIIVSAGLQPVIEEFLLQHNETLLRSPLLSIHANRMTFDESGVLVECAGEEDMIHFQNKHRIFSHCEAYFAELRAQGREHALLLGDSLEDVRCLEAIPYQSAIKIGFANRPTNDVREYLERYDAVIAEDGSFEYVNNVLNRLLGGAPAS